MLESAKYYLIHLAAEIANRAIHALRVGRSEESEEPPTITVFHHT
jgi:hypothetical protein